MCKYVVCSLKKCYQCNKTNSAAYTRSDFEYRIETEGNKHQRWHRELAKNKQLISFWFVFIFSIGNFELTWNLMLFVLYFLQMAESQISGSSTEHAFDSDVNVEERENEAIISFCNENRSQMWTIERWRNSESYERRKTSK